MTGSTQAANQRKAKQADLYWRAVHKPQTKEKQRKQIYNDVQYTSHKLKKSKARRFIMTGSTQAANQRKAKQEDL